MESNWRFNVWELGAADQGIRLAARWLDVPYEFWIGLHVDDFGTRRIVATGGPDPIFGYTFGFTGLFGTTPFPFGYNVTPD